MLKKEVFFHLNLTGFGSRSLGFSAIFVPDNPGTGLRVNENGDLMTWMAITYCNKKDKQFSKKIAREVLRNRAMELVRVRDIPKLLANAASKSWGHHVQVSPAQFDAVLRHFV